MFVACSPERKLNISNYLDVNYNFKKMSNMFDSFSCRLSSASDVCFKMRYNKHAASWIFNFIFMFWTTRQIHGSSGKSKCKIFSCIINT